MGRQLRTPAMIQADDAVARAALRRALRHGPVHMEDLTDHRRGIRYNALRRVFWDMMGAGNVRIRRDGSVSATQPQEDSG